MKFIRIIMIACSFVSITYAQELPIRVYGYLDLIARDFLEREFPNGATENPPPTFNLLRTHILLNSKFQTDWRAFLNLRFQGASHLKSDGQSQGEIDLLEGWFEWRHQDWLRIRGGQFLAPFGYFNTRKFQSPIFHTVVLPLMYEEEFLRRAAAGTIIPPNQNLQVLGNIYLDTWQLGYHLYAGNGSATDLNNLDVNKNKGIGARVWLKPQIRNLLAGVSFYAEEGEFAIRPHVDMPAMMMKAKATGVPMNSIVPIVPTVQQLETRKTIGFDVRYQWRNIEVRGEYVKTNISDLQLSDATAISDTTQSYTFDSGNFSKTFYYVQVNYTLFENLTPFFEVNVFKDPRHVVFRNQLTRLTFGAAFRPSMHVAIKGEFHNHLFGEKFNKKPKDFKNFQMFWLAVSVFFN